MGFYLSKLKETRLEEYIGSSTIHSCAEHGAFDASVSKDIEEFVNRNENIIGAVDASGIPHCLQVLANSQCVGRDVEKLKILIEEKFTNGFLIWF